MAKTKISEWSSTPGSNTDIDGINLAEGMLPSDVNNAMREMMSQIKDLQSANVTYYTADSDAIAVGAGGTGAITAASARTNLGVPSLSGNNTLAGVQTLSGLTASSAVATNASKELVSVTNTGSGNNVLATSPTITGATLTTAALNGTLGATTPSTVVATTVTTNGVTTLAGGNTTIKASYQLLLENAAGNDTYAAYNAGSTGTSTYSFRYAGVDRVIFDASGNVGVGVTPSAWNTNVKAAQLASGSVYSYTTVDLALTQNCYYNTSNQWIYSTTAPAERYSLYNGTHAWYTAPTGTAGNPITFTQAMTLDASGNLGVLGAITSNSKAVVTNITVASVPVGTTQISTNLTTSIGTTAGGWLIYATMGRGGASVADTYSAVYLYSATESAHTPTLRTILASDAPGNNNGNIAISGTTVAISWGGSRGPAAVTAIKLW